MYVAVLRPVYLLAGSISQSETNVRSKNFLAGIHVGVEYRMAAEGKLPWFGRFPDVASLP